MRNRFIQVVMCDVRELSLIVPQKMAFLAGLFRKPYDVVVRVLSEALAASSRFHEGTLVAFCAEGGSTMSSIGSDAGSPKDRSLCVAGF